MEPSGTGGPPKRSFPVATRAPANTATLMCFFCGESFPVASLYQRHIVDHQLASISYQLWAQAHPNPHSAGDRGEKKEEGRKRGKDKEKKGENGDEKKPKTDSSDSNTSLVSLPSPLSTLAPPPSMRAAIEQPSPFVVPSIPIKTPWPPARDSANNPQTQSMAGSSDGQQSMVRAGQAGPPGPPTDCPCGLCRSRFKNATELVIHTIREHEATILQIQVSRQFGNRVPTPDSDYEHTEECVYCNVKTPTLTKSFEHSIVYHKGHLMQGADLTAATYNMTFGVPSKPTFIIRLRLRKAATTKE